MAWRVTALLGICLLVVAARMIERETTVAQQDGPILRLEAPSGTVQGGNHFDVEIIIENVTDLAAFESTLQWDTTMVALHGITIADFLGQHGPTCDGAQGRCVIGLGPQPQGDGMAQVGAFSFGTGPTAAGRGVAALLHFQALPSAPNGSTSIIPLEAFMVNSDLVWADLAPSGTFVEIEMATATATPLPTETGVPTATRPPTHTNTPTATATMPPTHTSLPEATATATPTFMPTGTQAPTETSTVAPSSTLTHTPTATMGPTQTATATTSPTAPPATPMASATATPTTQPASPTVPSTATTEVSPTIVQTTTASPSPTETIPATATPNGVRLYLPLIRQDPNSAPGL